MFQTLIANAIYSPSMATAVGYYIHRLRQEEFSRRLGLIFMGCAMVIQSLALISPPEPTIAAGPNNIIYNGITSLNDLIDKYDRNTDGNGNNDVQQIFTQYGISRNDLLGAKLTTIKSTDRGGELRSIGRKAYGLPGELAVQINNSDTTVYERPLATWDSGSYSSYQALEGFTSDGRYFAVLMSCGNLVVDEPTPAPQLPEGSVIAACSNITGWAYDPNEPDQSLQIVAYIRLEDDPTDFAEIITSANQPAPTAPVGGNHGFSVDIPVRYTSSTERTIYTVIAYDSSGEGTIDLARTRAVDGYCQSEPEPEPVPTPPTPTETPTPCVYDSTLTEDDPLCRVCPYQDDILSSDSRCIEPAEEPDPCPYRPSLDDTDPDCQPCPYDNELWFKDEGCDEPFALLVFEKQASNLTQDIIDAHNTTAQPGDILEYNLVVENVGNQVDDYQVIEDLGDLLEYGELTNDGGGTFDESSGVITWPTETIQPQAASIKTIQITIFSTIPATPSPENNPESYNLTLRNTFENDTIVVKVPRPITKTPEVLARTLPNTGPGTNTLIMTILLSSVTYFYVRNRQLTEELVLVREDLTAGV
jgi:hypothetical protein